MYRVLIADDDVIVRMTIINMLKQGKHIDDLEIAGSVINGREAVACLEQGPVDMVITDIQMPGMGGLELIDHIRTMEEPPEILVLSAYNDFIYVRQAFQKGIYDYCLKNELNGEILDGHIANMKERLRRRGRTGNPTEEEPDRGKCLAKWLEGSAVPGKGDLPSLYYLVCFRIENEKQIMQVFGENSEKELYMSLQDLAGQISPIAAHGSFSSSGPVKLVMLYDSGTAENGSLERLLLVCKRLLHAWKNYMNVEAAAGISSVGREPEDFTDRFREAYLNMGMKIVIKRKNIFSPADYEKFCPTEVYRHERKFNDLLFALKINDAAMFEEEKRRLLQKIKEENVETARKITLETVYFIITELIYRPEETKFLREEDLPDLLKGIVSNHEIRIWMVNFLNDVRKYMQMHYQFERSGEMDKALSYIGNHYDEPELSLSAVAAEAGFSEKYFSSLFTKNMGMPFSAYLKKLRLSYAKEMLSDTDMKIKEIAEAAGYGSVEYFIRVFTAQEEMSPSRYRKKRGTPSDTM